MTGDLNQLSIPTDERVGAQLKDNSTQGAGGETVVYFRNLTDRLIDHIRQADLVVGCVAWLTSEPILAALARVPEGVSIVVQKEDFLRPDLKARGQWARRLRSLYEALPEGPDRYYWPGLPRLLSVCGNPTLEAVRCVGNHNRDKNPAFPRMHNKFLVFCRAEWDDEADIGPWNVEPYAVWTGSFNLTYNASMSLENALLLRDPAIVHAYFKEWEQIVALSEPLDWSSQWSAPQWRIGT